MLKILQAKLQQYITKNFQMYKLDLAKSEEPEIKLPIFTGSWRKQRSSRKTSSCVSLTMLKPLYGSQQTGKFLKWWENHYILPVSWETCMWVKKQQLEPYMKKLTGSKLGKEYNKAGYCHHVYLTYMQSTSWEMLGWINHKLESSLQREISTVSDKLIIPL